MGQRKRKNSVLAKKNLIPRSTKTKLRRIYYNPEDAGSFGSAQSLYTSAKPFIKSLTLKQVVHFLEEQNTYTLHRKIRLRFPTRKTVVPKIDSQWQADLVSVENLSKDNAKHRFILTVIDVLSRYAFAVPLKSKHGTEIVKAFQKIFRHSKRKPKCIQTDKGREFLNQKFQTFLARHKISHFTTNSDTKASIVERFNRTLKNKMFRYFTANNTLNYVKVLDKLVKSYNNKVHRSLKIEPSKVTRKNERKIWETLYGDYYKTKNKRHRFEIGDNVRITKWRHAFQRGYLPGWSKEIFTVVEVVSTIPPVYRLCDKDNEMIEGIFYESELGRVRHGDP